MGINKTKKVVVIGGGPAGMESASYLSNLDFDTTIIEKDSKLGGKLNVWDCLFPTIRPAAEVKSFLEKGVEASNINVRLESEVVSVNKIGNTYMLKTNKNEDFEADAVIIATGFDVFNAHKKEEYGYGIYDNVITSKDLEAIFLDKKELLRADGKPIRRVGLVHCVGSRDEKIGNLYCSKACCVTGVKQAIELHEKMPEAEIFCFYMDLRMFGLNYEDLYKKAQEQHNVQFIRGRLSESAEALDGSVIVKVEDTLTGRPMKMSVDLLVLLVGMEPSEGTKKMSHIFGLETNSNRFLKEYDENTSSTVSNIDGVFLAGTCTAPRSIAESLNDARSAALRVAGYLNKWDIDRR